MALSVAQESRQVHDGWWEWAVWIEGDKAELDGIDVVEWLLHSTFPEPLQRVNKRASKFRLTSGGWGEFTIYATVHRNRGRSLKLRHWLSLDATTPQPRSTPAPKRRRAATRSPAPAGRDEGAQTKRLFISSSVADAAFAHTLADAIAAQGHEVFTAEDLAPGDRSLQQPALLRQTAAAIVVTSGPLTRGVLRELTALRDGHVPILPVLIGPDARLPSDFDDIKAIRLKASSDAELEREANAIVARVTKLTK